MAITLVQANVGTFTTSGTVSFSSPTTAGNCVVVAIAAELNGTFSVSSVTLGGAAGNFSQLAVANANDGAANWAQAFIWADPGCAGGQTAVAVTLSGGAAAAVWIYEVSGLASSGVLDQSSTGTGTSSSWSSGTTPTTTLANEFWIGVGVQRNSSGNSTLVGPSSPWTNEAAQNLGSLGGGLSGYQITSNTGTATYGGTGSALAVESAGAVVTLKGAALAAGLPVINPGPAWLEHFKPFLPKPHPPVPPDKFSLDPRTLPNLSDVPQIQPGQGWLRHFKKPQLDPKPPDPQIAYVKLTDSGHGTDSIARYPLSDTGSGSDSTGVTVYPCFPLSNVLGAKVELLINNTWTDITSYVYQRADIVITRGRPDETQTNNTPSTCTLTLNNRDGRFTAGNSQGVWYPYVTRNVQLRVSIVASSESGSYYSGYRFWGEVSSWPVQWDPTGNDVYIQVTASGPLRRMVQGALNIGSPLRRYLTSLTGNLTPIAYWPCEDASTAQEFGSAIQSAPSGTFTGSPQFQSDSSFGGSDALPVINGSSWHFVTDWTPSGTGQIVQDTPGAYEFTVPAGITSMDVLVTGAGGGGGDHGSTAGGGGGGGGEFAEESALAVTPGTTYQYTVGAGGTAAPEGGGAAGQNGGDSAFHGDSVTVTGHGGHGGAAGHESTGGAGGAAGTGSSNTSHHNGGAGGTGQSGSSSHQEVYLYGTTGASGTSRALDDGTTSDGVTTQSWTAPSGVTSAEVRVTGAGGGGEGGGAYGGGYGGGGGGGGAFADGEVAVTPGKSYTMNAGNGGAGGAAGGYVGHAGGTSSFAGDSSSVSAGGGTGGHNGGTGGSAGTASGGNYHNIDGFAGGQGSNSGGHGGGGGGGGGAGATGAGTAASGRTPGVGGYSTGAGGGWGSSSYGGGDGSGGGTGVGVVYAAPFGGGGGGGGGASTNTTGWYGGGGGAGSIWVQYVVTGAPSGGGGGASGGTSAAGNAGTNSGSGGAAVTGGGAGGNQGKFGGAPGGGGGGAQPADSSLNISGAAAANGSAGQVKFSWSGGSGTAVTGNVVRFALHGSSTGMTNGTVVARILTIGTVAKLEVTYQTGGKLTLTGYNGVGGSLFASSSTAFSLDGQPVYVDVELVQNGTGANWKLSAIKPGASSVIATASGTVASVTVGSVSDVYIAPNSDIADSTAAGQVVVAEYAPALTALGGTGGVGPLNGYAGEYAADRISRLCSEEGLGFRLVGANTDTPQMGPQVDDSLLNLFQYCEDADKGILFEDRTQLGLAYRTRVNLQSQNPVLNLDYSEAQLSQGLIPAYDDQYTRNDITLTRFTGTSVIAQLTSGSMSILDPPDGVGDYTYTNTVYLYQDSQLANLAEWMLTVGTVDEPRYPVIPVDLSRAENQDIFSNVAGLDVGDFIQILNMPYYAGPTVVHQLYWGATENINAYTWFFQFNAVPESPYAEGDPPSW